MLKAVLKLPQVSKDSNTTGHHIGPLKIPYPQKMPVSVFVLLKHAKQGRDLLNSVVMHYLKNSGRVRWRKLQSPHPQTALRSANLSVGPAGPTDGSSIVSFLRGQILAFNSWAIRDCKTCSRFPSILDWLFSHLPLADNHSP